MATLTVYPDPSSGSTTVDGWITSGYGATMAIAHATTTGDGANPVSPYTPKVCLPRTLKNGSGFYLGRFFATFDTSALGSSATISAATLSLYGDSTFYSNTSGTETMEIVATSPASNNNLVTTDFDNMSFTSFASLALSSYSQSAYNDFTLDSNGIANVSKTGISKFGVCLGNDFNITEMGTNDHFISITEADYTGTTRDPKLVVTYTIAAGPANLKSYNTNVTANIKSINTNAIANVKSLNTNV